MGPVPVTPNHGKPVAPIMQGVCWNVRTDPVGVAFYWSYEMSYVLEAINEDGQEKVIRDASCDPAKQAMLKYALSRQEFPNTWAIDHMRNCYLFLAPTSTREDSWSRSYFVFMDGLLYKIVNDGACGNKVYFSEESLPSGETFRRLKDEISSAFFVYGRWGHGPLNEYGKPEFTLTPVFIESAE